MSQYTLHLLPAKTALDDYAQGWRELQKRVAACPMASVEWAQAYLQSYGNDKPGNDKTRRVLIAIAERQGKIAAVMPLVERTPLGYRYFELLNSSELWEPSDMLYESVDALSALMGYILKRGLPLILPRHPCDAPSGAVIASVQGASKILRRSRPGSPRVSIGENPEEVLNAGRRSDLRRAMKRAEKLGAVTFKVFAPTADEFPALLATAVEVEAASWKGPNNSALKYDASARTFYEHYGPIAIRAGVLRMAFMYIDQTPVAMQLMCECSDALWLMKIGYDAKFSACSPGQLLMMEVIRYASQQKLARCEFLGKAEVWTKMWTDVEFGTENITLLPRSRHSLLHLGTLAASKVLSRLKLKKTMASPGKQ